MTRTTIILPTDELQLGDIVSNHGMTILLDRPPVISPDHTGNGRVYAWIGLVTNPEDVRADGIVPMSWLRHPGSSAELYPNGEHRWNVQGNHLARWSVSREI